MKSTRTAILLVVVCMVLLMSSGRFNVYGLGIGLMDIPFISGPWVTEEVDLELPASSLASVLTKTHNGFITVSGSGDADMIIVHVIKKAKGSSRRDSEKALEAIEIQTSVTDGAQNVGWKWDGRKGLRWQSNVSFEIVLPARLAVGATTHNGAIKVEGTRSGGQLNSHNGHIEATNLRGDIEIKNHNGRIALAGLESDVTIRTHNGKIEIVHHAGAIDISTHNSHVDIVSAVSHLKVSTHNGRIEGDLSGSGSISGEVSTHNGSITLMLGDTASTQLLCTTKNGRISTSENFRVDVGEGTTRSSRNKSVTATVGAGEGSLKIASRNGSISVR